MNQRYILRLYVTGETSRSLAAIENLKRVCEQELEGGYEVEVVDLLQSPHLAEEEKIVATPTLVKVLPLPIRRIIGDLSDHEKVLAGLDLTPRT